MRKLTILLFIIILIKLLNLGLYQIFDTTEGRYTGIAFRMAYNNNFLTPYNLPDQEFLAKPPFAFWIGAIFFKIFGIYHEFVARLPYFLTSILILFTGFFWVKKETSKIQAYQFGIIFASTVGFAILAGTVMVDACLLLGVTLTNMGFFYGLTKKRYGYIFFLGLSISVLSKGLIGIVISGIGCFLFTLIKNKWKELLNFPILGFLMFLLLTLPWFILMEMNHSGFLNYFFIGEHFQRFLIKNWSGDKYGFAHSEPFFTILIFFVICSFQWFIYACFICYKNRKQISFKNLSDFNLFTLLNFITPLVFFSFSRNIIIPYATLSLVSFCVLIAINYKINFKALLLLSIPFSLIGFISFAVIAPNIKITDKMLIQEFNNQNKQNQKTLYYLQKPDFSAYFYAKDNITIITNKDLKQLSNVFFVSSGKHEEEKIICNKARCLYKK